MANDDDRWRDPFRGWRRPLEENGIYRGMDLARIAMTQVIEGSRRATAVCGGSGCGKSHLLRRLLKLWNLPLLPPMEVASEAAMVKYAWRHRNERIVPIEDNGKMFRHETLVDRLKQMTESPARLHTTETDEVMTNMKRMTSTEQVMAVLAEMDPVKRAIIEKAPLRDPAIPESDFEVNFGIIITTNTNLTVRENIAPAMKTHWQAMLSRGLNPLWIPDDPFDTFEYTLHLVFEGSFFRTLHLKLDDANAVLRAYIENRGHLTDVSPRALRLMATMRKNLRESGRLNYWEREVRAAFLSDKVVQPALAKLDVPTFQIPTPGSYRAPVTVRDPDPEPDPPATQPPPPPAPEPDRDEVYIDKMRAALAEFLDPPAPPTPGPEPESAARMSIDEARSWFLTQAGARASDLVSQQAMERMDLRIEKLRPRDYDPDFDANSAHAWEVLWGTLPAREPGAKAPTDGPAPDPKPDPAATVSAEVRCAPEPDPLPPAPKPEPTPPVDDDWPYDGQPIDPPVAGEPDDLSKDLDAMLLERLRAQTGPFVARAEPATKTPPPEPRPVHEKPLREQFRALRARRMAERQADDARPAAEAPTETPPPEPPSGDEKLLLEKLRARRAAQQATEKPVGGPYDARSTKPTPKPEPYEYSQNEPEDRRRRRTKVQIRRDQNRTHALRIAARFPLQWDQAAKRTRGDVVKFGWVKLWDNGGEGKIPVLTDEGKERLERYEDEYPPD